MVIFRWLGRALWLLPNGLAALGGFVALAGALILAAWLLSNPDYAVGRVDSVYAVPERDLILAAVGAPGRPFVKLAAAGEGARALSPGDWVLARVEGTAPGRTEPILWSADLVSTRAAAALPSLEEAAALLRGTPLAAVIGGALLILAGALLGAHISALVLALVLGIAGWHGLHLAHFEGLIRLPPGALLPLVAACMALGLAMGLRAGRNRLSEAVQRMTAVILMLAPGPLVIEHFGWPLQWALILLVPLALMAPLSVYALLGAWLLILGLDARGEAAYGVLGLSALAALVIRAAVQPPPEREPRAPMAAETNRPPLRRGEIPLVQLLNGGR